MKQSDGMFILHMKLAIAIGFCRFFEMVIQSVVRCFGWFANAMSNPFLLV